MNCKRSFPWVHGIEEKYAAKGLQVIGIHTPEFDYEKNRDEVVSVVDQYQIKYPIMMDNDFRYWKALENRYWPSFYLVDQKGRIIYKSAGEMRVGDSYANKFEEKIKSLLN
ncbi:MAG: redoxin family protein [Proteobacteria bacterium]|nr:redoxin family protein [Pseudomonadota bacterium]